MTMLGCKWHPSQDNVGVCAHCLHESLSRLAVCQDEEDDSIDLEISPPSMPSGMPAGSRRAQFILAQYVEEGNPGGLAGDNSDLFYPGVNRNAMGALVGGNQHMQPYIPEDHEPTDLHLDGADHADMQGEVSTSEDYGLGGQDEAMAHNMPPTGESGRHKRKLHPSASRGRKPKGWGAAMMKMVGFRTLSVLWRSERKVEANSSRTKPNEQGFEGSVDSAVPTHDQQYTPPRFSTSSGLEQTTPARYFVSSQWEQLATPPRHSVALVQEQVTPARYSGASLFDIESMDSRRFSTSSRGSPFTGNKHVINGENFNAAWRASKSHANARKMGAYEGFGGDENFSSGKVLHSGMRNYGDEGAEQYVGKSPKKSPWKWFSSSKSTTPKEDGLSSQQKVAIEASAADSGYQERRKSTSSMYAIKPKDRTQQTLTPVLTSKKSPWWRSSPRPKTPKSQKSPLMIPTKAGNRDQEVATDSDFMDDTPHRLSSASPMVGYSRSSSNGSSCFTTPRWNNRQRPQHSGNRGMAVHEREHEITHLAI